MLKRMIVAGAVLALAACGSGGGTSTPTPVATPLPIADKAAVTMTLPTDFVPSVPSGNPDFPLDAFWTATLAESAGLGGNVNFYRLRFPENPNDAGFTVGADQIVKNSGSNHVPARGSLPVKMGIEYRLGFGKTVAVVGIEVDFTDDHGNHQTLTGTVTVR